VNRSTAYDSADDAPLRADQPRGLRSYDLGVLAALAVAVAYGLSAEVFGLTWGLIAVGFVGGIVIGGAVTRGAWQDAPHVTVRRIQVMAGLIALGGWIVGLFLAYVVSQALIPQAGTPLLERLSFGRFSDYFLGLDEHIRLIHAASMAASVFTAWRGAR
jgi:hypothetical protein